MKRLRAWLGLPPRQKPCWNCRRPLRKRRIAWVNDKAGTTCWRCPCGMINVRQTDRAERPKKNRPPSTNF